jgi:hypothetical protein
MIVIPSATRCSDCKLVCEQIYRIETEHTQNQAFEDQTWLLLQAALAQTVETPPIEPDWYTQAFQDFQNGTDFQPTFGHGNPTTPKPSGTIYTPRSPAMSMAPLSELNPTPYPHREVPPGMQNLWEAMVIQDQRLINDLMRLHYQQSRPEGYEAQTTLLHLAGRYRAEPYIQPICDQCALIHHITTKINEQLIRHY